MKYYFIINPISGSCDKTEILTKEIKEAFLNNTIDEYEIYRALMEAGDMINYEEEEWK